jgi:hypothetical protein
MRKTAIATVVSLWASTAIAQAPPPPGGAPMPGPQGPPAGGIVAKGIMAGVNLATFAGDDVADTVENRLGFAVGGFVVYALGGQLVAAVDLLYSQKGAKNDVEGTTVTIAFDYIEVPVGLCYVIPTRGQMLPFVCGGGSVAFLLGAELRADGDSQDVKDEASSIDLGAVLSAGAAVGSLTGELRYTHGLTDVDSTDTFSAYNRALSVYAAYAF